MASQVTRFAWTDDSGTPPSPVGDGTKINNAQLQLIFDAVDALFASGTFTLGGLLRVEGAGAHLFTVNTAGTNKVEVRNLNTGTAGAAEFRVGNSLSDIALTMGHLSSGFTPSGYYVADRSYIVATRGAGLVISAENASGEIKLSAGGAVVRGRVMAAGRLAWDSGYATSSLSTPTGIEIGSTSGSPDKGQLIFGDGTGYNFSVGAVVGGNYTKRFTVDDRGYVQGPSQPGFHAYNSADDSAITTNVTAVDFDSENYDVLGNFASDTFTAPVAGYYVVTANLMIYNNSGGRRRFYGLFNKSGAGGVGSTYFGMQDVPNTEYAALSGSMVLSLAASETVTVGINLGEIAAYSYTVMAGSNFSARLLV